MAEMVVAYYIKHDNGVERGTLDAPGQETGLELDSLSGARYKIMSFSSLEAAEEWLSNMATSQEYWEKG